MRRSERNVIRTTLYTSRDSRGGAFQGGVLIDSKEGWERKEPEEEAPHAAGATAVAPAIGEGAPFGPDVGGRTEVLNPVSDALLAALDPTARAAPIMHFAEDAAAPTPSPGAAAVKNALQRGIDASVRTIGIRVARKKALKAHAARAASVRDDEHVGGIGLTDIHRI